MTVIAKTTAVCASLLAFALTATSALAEPTQPPSPTPSSISSSPASPSPQPSPPTLTPSPSPSSVSPAASPSPSTSYATPSPSASITPAASPVASPSATASTSPTPQASPSATLVPLWVTKTVTGDFPNLPQRYTLTVECRSDDSGHSSRVVLDLAPGVATLAGHFPAGLTCKIIQERPSAPQGLAQRTDFTASVTTVAGQPAQLISPTVYSQIPPVSHSLRLGIELSENGSSSAQPLMVSYRCDAPGKGWKGEEVPATGTLPITSSGLTIGYFFSGTTCAITQLHNTHRPGYEVHYDLGKQIVIGSLRSFIKIHISYGRQFAPLRLHYSYSGVTPWPLPTMELHYHCSSAGKKLPRSGKITITAGSTITLDEFPVYTACTASTPRHPGLDYLYQVSTTPTSSPNVHPAGSTWTVHSNFSRQFVDLKITNTVHENGSAGSPRAEFTYRCIVPGPSPQQVAAEGKINVATNTTTTISGLSPGLVCKVARTKEPRSGYYLVPARDQQRTLSGSSPNIFELVTNYYPAAPLRVHKLLDGPPSGGAPMRVNVKCVLPDTDKEIFRKTVQVVPGQIVDADQVPVGSQCAFAYLEDSWRLGYRLTKSVATPVTITTGGATITVKSSYVPIELREDLTGFYVEYEVAGRTPAPGERATIHFDCHIPPKGSIDPNRTPVREVTLAPGERVYVAWAWTSVSQPATSCWLTRISGADREGYRHIAESGPKADQKVPGQNFLQITSRYQPKD